MKIMELMTRDVEACHPDDDLAAVAMIMWRRNCGIVPVVDDQNRVLGTITDRDICIATATRHRAPAALRAQDVTSPELFTVGESDDVRVALDVMRYKQVRRVPVVDANRKLKGIVSVNDIVLSLKVPSVRHDAELSPNEVLLTMQSICRHPEPEMARERKEKLVVAHA